MKITSDFGKKNRLEKDIEAEFEQLKFTGGHNYVTGGYTQRQGIREIACAHCEKAGMMEVLSDCPCVQFMQEIFVEQEAGKNGHIYDKRDGFCLETQVEPNAVNVEEFHSPVLEKRTLLFWNRLSFSVK